MFGWILSGDTTSSRNREHTMTLAILLNDDNCGFASLMVSRKRTLGALLSAILNVLRLNKKVNEKSR